MKTVIAGLLIMICAARAENIVVWDSRAALGPPQTNLRVIDAGLTNTYLNPDFRLDYRRVTSPAIYDTDTKEWATWTGTETGTLDAIETASTNRYTVAQRRGERAMKSLRTTLGLPPRATPIKVLGEALDASLTNSAASASRTLSQASAAFILLQQAKESGE